MEEKQETFNYTYSAKRQEELEKIREKYISREEDKMEQLRRLDRSVTRPGMMCSVMVGTIGTLVFGIGMCCVMVWNLFALGIAIGVIGMAGMAAAYPVFLIITKKRKEEIAPQILSMAEELMEK